MRTIDFTPLHRFAVGFDRVQRQMDAAMTHMNDQATAYPPYNIEVVGEDAYRITMAVAGFAEDDLEISVKEDTLFVSGNTDKGDGETHYLHHGIATRTFTRRFELAEHIKVPGASLINGMLHIELKREVPEEKKARGITIDTDAKPKTIEKKAA